MAEKPKPKNVGKSKPDPRPRNAPKPQGKTGHPGATPNAMPPRNPPMGHRTELDEDD